MNGIEVPGAVTIIALFAMIVIVVKCVPHPRLAQQQEVRGESTSQARWEAELCFNSGVKPSGTIVSTRVSSATLAFVQEERGRDRHCALIALPEGVQHETYSVRVQEAPRIKSVELCRWGAPLLEPADASRPSQCTQIYPNDQGTYLFQLTKAADVVSIPIFEVLPR